LSLSWYTAGDSLLHRASSLSKISFVFCLWIACFVFYSPFWNSLELLFIVAVVLSARIPLSSMKALIKIIVPIMVVFLILFPLVIHGGEIYFQYGPIVISWLGISQGIIAAARLGSLFLSTIGILLTTTRERDLIDGLMKGGLPYGPSFMLMLTLRFISLSMTDLALIRESRRARGMPERENLIQLLRNLISIVIPLFLATIRRIQTSTNALEVKGFSPGSRRTNIRKGKISGREIFWGVFFLIVIALLVILRLELGWFV
jgi:energy-coupling factor transport system permease protein